MKKLFILCSLLIVSLAAFCQVDTTGLIINQGIEIAKKAKESNLLENIMLFSAIAGFLVHTIWNTYKGVKRKTGTPFTFAPKYFIADNAYPKIIALITIFSGSAWFSNLIPNGLTGLILVGIISFIAGFYLDWIIQYFNVDPKSTLKPSVK